MDKKVEVSYNPQLGYLKTIFDHNFDFLTEIISYTEQDTGVEFVVGTYKLDRARVEIQILSETAYRFLMFPYGNTNVFRNEVFHFKGITDYEVVEEKEFIIIYTNRILLKVRKKPWEISVYLDGRLLTKEQILDSNVDNMCKYLPIGFEFNENKEVTKVRETMYMYSDEAFYGFGEKFTEFNKRGQVINCWQSDALSTNTEKSYKNHPYYMSSRGYSVLVNNFTRIKFDMGAGSNVSYCMEVEDSYLDYIIICNKDYKGLLANYIELTDNIPMIPKWAFGLWMSKCVYRNQEEVYQVVNTAKEKKVMIDVINLDAWQSKDSNGAWVWDRERFPNPDQMITFLKKNHIHLCLWIYPYISEDSEYFIFAQEKGYLVKDITGKPVRFYATATSAYKVGCFDFTNPDFITWYKDRVKEVIKMDIGAVKTDFSEAVPENAVYFDGTGGIQGHNKLTYLYAKTIYEIMKEVKEKTGERPMLWGRSGYAGSHSIPAAWAGDSSTHLNNHGCILKGGLSIALSGVAYWGFDMGGFYNTDYEGYESVPTKEEYIRSIQFGFFSPLSRCHGKTPREPWNFDKETQTIFTFYNNLRHRMLPYLYSMAYKSSKESIPMIRPLLLEFQEDRNVMNIGLEYMLGESLLVAPVFDQDEFNLYLPQGSWADFFTGELIEGGNWIQRNLTISEIPVYMRENTVVPMLWETPAYIIESNFSDLVLFINLKDSIYFIYYDDDFKGECNIELENGTVSISTNLDIKSTVIYTKSTVSKIICNEAEYTFNRVNNTTYEVLLR